MTTIALTPIGVIRTPYQTVEGMPIQPAGAADTLGRVELNDEYVNGLKDLDGFSRIILIYQFHQSAGYDLIVKPFMDDTTRGLFSTRAPRRPNPIGISIVELLQVEANTLHVVGIDVLDGTPLLDIKPYVPRFDSFPEAAIGWMTGKDRNARALKADKRFKS